MSDVSDARTAPRRRRWPAARHLALSALLWLTYGLYWRVVLHRGIESEARTSALLLGLFVLLQGLTTLGWIAHNRRLASRHAGRRRSRPAVAPAPSHDFVGRHLESFPGDTDLTRAPVIVVRLEEGRKLFQAGLPLPDGRRVSA